MSRFLSRFLLLGVASFALVACGGGGASDVTTTPQPPAPAAVASVSVSLSASSLLPGRSTTASAELRSAAGAVLTGRSISWSSSNTAIATVDGSGNVTAVATGTSTISATSEGKTGSASITVLPAPVASVSVTLAASQVVVGTATSATAVAKDDRGNTLSGRVVTFTSSVPSVATVDANGTVTTITPGATNIVATSEGQSGTATLTVIPPPVATVSITLAQNTLTPSGTTTSNVTLRDANGAVLNGRTVTFTSSAPTVATVNASGAVTAVAPGTTNITATSEGKSASATLTVQLPPVSTVTVTGTATLAPGATAAYSATLRDASGATLTGRNVVWNSSDPSVATVTAIGVVTAIAPGAVSIIATSEGKSGSAALTVRYNIATVTVTGTNRMKVGDTYAFSAVAKLADGTVVSRPLTWSIKEAGLGTITASGALTPLQAGTLTVQIFIDGDVWESTYTAYDWVTLSGSGNTFLTLDADNLITNKFGSSEYAQLVFACSSGGSFFVWVQTNRFVTQNGLVTYSFDTGGPISTFWTESSDFSTLFRPGNNGVSKAFAAQIAASRVFIFVFTEYNATAKGSTFRVTGLSSKITALYSLCPSNALVVPGNANAIAAGMRSNAVSSETNIGSLLAAERSERASRSTVEGPTQAAEQAMLLSPTSARSTTAGMSSTQAVKRRR